jgi:hypothetical protein
MRPTADETPRSPEDRTREPARVLATGLLRLHDRAALPEMTPGGGSPKLPCENSLEIPPELP